MDVYAHAADIVRTRDRDRYIADLFAPEPVRQHLFALHAFAAEIARVHEVVREPSLAEIRMQWWREAIANSEPSGHPIAEALTSTIKQFRLPIAAFDMLIEARIFDLYDDPMPTMNDLEGYAGETASGLLQLGAMILAGGRDVGAADAAGHAGVAETLVGILRALALRAPGAAKYVPDALFDDRRASRQDLADRNPRPEVLAVVADIRAAARGHLARATDAVGSLPPQITPVFLPLSVAAARLDRMERNAATPFAAVDVALWRRQWIMWRAAQRAKKRR